MNTELSTLPKPFVFVLMPIVSEFSDIYKFGIKGAAEDAGAYAERLDEQIFSEGMLERIFNQISKADVIVADMTGRNPNVFYEVGYAHALGKIVLLLTQKADDIPFDLKHRQHTVYGGSINILRQELTPKIQWAIAESKRRAAPGKKERFSIRIANHEIFSLGSPNKLAELTKLVAGEELSLPLSIRNDSAETVSGITHVYLFAQENAPFVAAKHVTVRHKVGPMSTSSKSTNFISSRSVTITQAVPLQPILANPIDAPDGLVYQYRLEIAFPSLPPGAVEASSLIMILRKGVHSGDALYRLRLHTPSQYHDYPFRLRIESGKTADVETNRAPVPR